MTDLSPFPMAVAARPHPPRVALLIDGDNVPVSALPQLEAQAAAMGPVVIRRVYADMRLRADWAARLDLETVHCASGQGRNHADIRLVIGALDIAHRGLAQAFVILSDDRDFLPLVAHLRETGFEVRVLGKPKAAPLTAVDQALRQVLQGRPDGVAMQKLGAAMRDYPVKTSTGKASWRAYLRSRPDLYRLGGEGQATFVHLAAKI